MNAITMHGKDGDTSDQIETRCWMEGYECMGRY